MGARVIVGGRINQAIVDSRQPFRRDTHPERRAGRARAGSEILSLDKRATLFIDAPSHVVNAPFREERLVWRKIEQPEADKFGLETKA